MQQENKKSNTGIADTALVELLDRVLDKGVVVQGEISISVANVDLIYLGLKVLLTSIDKLEELRKEGYVTAVGGPLKQ